MRRLLPVIILALLMLAALAAYAVLWSPNVFEGDRFVTVSKGESFQSVLDSLQHAGIIRSRTLFSAAGRLLGLTTRMQIGKYRFTSGMSNTAILEDLRYGKTVEALFVTLPEGLRASRQARILAHQVGIDSSRFMRLVTDSGFCRSLGVEAPTLEGYLMPSTYKIYWQTDEADVIKMLVGEFWKFWNDSLRSVLKTQGRTMNDVLTLASIVEGETSVDSERAMVAGVYENRLEKRMLLQADPTVQYILEGGPRRLHYSDLQRESAYNTYIHRGLPPGPINNPGKASMLAALSPKRHHYLFFVATGQGGHYFARTFSEHLRARRRFQKMREEQQAIRANQG